MAEHEHFIKKTSSKTVVSIRHALIDASQRKRIETSVHRRKSSVAAPGLSVSISARPAEPAVIALRYEYYTISGQKKKCHRVFVSCSDSKEYVRLGWVLNDDIDACMVCLSSFNGSMISGKHHCRACGNIVCGSCSQARAVVQEAESLGPVRVCSQCCYGQDMVFAHINDDCGETYSQVTSLENGLEEVLREEWDEESGSSLRLACYGPVQLATLRPLFVLRTRRTDRTRVFVNICSCEQVPYNESIQVAEKRVVFLVCGSKGKTVDNYAVYDIALNPREAAALDSDPEAKNEVCQQALLCMSALTPEGDFFSYQWETDLVYKERQGQAPAVLLAVPAAPAFSELWQCCTRLEDVARALEQQPDSNAAQMHRERLLRKLTMRSGQQSRVDSLVTAESHRQQRSLQLTPHAGFVVKTRKSSDHLKKVFINVYHHEDVDAFVQEDPDSAACEEPRVLVGDASDVSDKEGVISLLYHVVVASKYFLESYAQSSSKITDAPYIQKILDVLNERFQDDLDKSSFVMPRVKGGFKGEWLAEDMLFSYSRPRRAISSSEEAAPSLLSLGAIDQLNNRPSGPRDSDSVVSDTSCATDASGFSLSRKSIVDLFYPQKQRPTPRMLGTTPSHAPSQNPAAAGTDLITVDMLKLDRNLNLDLRGALQLKQLSVAAPLVLAGWQVTLFDKQNKSDVYVITGARKNHLRKVEYRLTNLEKGDSWVRLKRSEKKSGVPFTINRRVLELHPSL